MKLLLVFLLILLELYICFSASRIHTVNVNENSKIVDLRIHFSFYKCLFFILSDVYLFMHIF